jgi:NodT family efflux transporter outer membrane factor (OMF) lipoprotein
MRSLSYILFLGTLLLMNGCTATRPPVTPAAEILGLHEGVVADQDWWQCYGNKQIEALVTMALERNVDYAKASVAVHKALYRANFAGADLLPEFTGQGSGETSRQIKGNAPSLRSFGAGLTVAYEIDFWRKIADSHSARKWELQASREDHAAVRLVLIASVVENCLDKAYLDAAVSILQKKVDIYQNILKVTKARYRVGKADSLDLEKAGQIVFSAKQTLLELDNQKKSTEHAIRLLLHLLPNDNLDMDFGQLLTLAHPEIDLEVPVAVLANRPDVRAAEFRLQSSFYAIREAQKELYPGITIFAALTSSSDNLGTIFNVPFTQDIISINFPFLQWNKLKWNIKIAESDYDELKLDFESSVITALNEVNIAKHNYSASLSLMENAEMRYNNARSISEYYRLRYKNGKSELADWLDALDDEASMQLALYDAKISVLQRQKDFYKAMGGRYVQAASSAQPVK